jgi:hypothetical protein
MEIAEKFAISESSKMLDLENPKELLTWNFISKNPSLR